MTPDDEVLRRIAEEIADLRSIDWEQESVVDGPLAVRLGNLRLLDAIRSLHQDSADPDGATTTEDAKPGPSAEPEIGSYWGPLRIVERVGHGSFGDVFRAWDPTLQTHVALKLLHRRRGKPGRLLREARQMAKVRHENVVTVHGAAEHDGRIGIWTEFIEGKTLEQELSERGAYGADEAALVGRDLVRAIAAVHAAGLVHRDIKTTNIMRAVGGRLVLMDFGTVIDREQLESLGPSDAFVGTALYMAPELFLEGHGGKAADVYSLGVVLYRLVTGTFPVDAKNPIELGAKHRRGERVPLRDARPDLPAAFVSIVDRALATTPEDRPGSMGEMERELVSFLSALPGDPRSVRRSLPRWILPLAATALVVVAILLWSLVSGGAGELRVDAELFRDRVGVEERLRAGGRVQPGDHLFLELLASTDFHAYVFNEDEQGNTHLLFPLTGLEPSNPLEGGRTHRLPGSRDGVPLTWDVDAYGGRETLYIVASRAPLEDLEAEMRRFPEAGSSPGIPIGSGFLRRSIGGLGSAAAERAADEPTLGDFIGRLSTERTSELWTWSIQLENQPP